MGNISIPDKIQVIAQIVNVLEQICNNGVADVNTNWRCSLQYHIMHKMENASAFIKKINEISHTLFGSSSINRICFEKQKHTSSDFLEIIKFEDNLKNLLKTFGIDYNRLFQNELKYYTEEIKPNKLKP